MKKITIGILAHVDAGKTTLAEAMLYISGAIRRQGRVDHGDTFLDTDKQERSRGITIFSKQAEMRYGDTSFMLLDTPGHVDFSAETERTLSVLDYAVLVIAGKEGIQGHTTTLWELLAKYEIPVFIFINKMDIEGSERDLIMRDLKERLNAGCIEFVGVECDGEEAAECSETLLEEYFDKGHVSNGSVATAIQKRELFPCCFGSALKSDGVEELMKTVDTFTLMPQYGEKFAAQVYKVTRDEQGRRLSHLKITGGKLKVKDTVGVKDEAEKIDQIRMYSGGKYRRVSEASAGDVCAVTGLKKTYAGQSLGAENRTMKTLLEPAITYDIILPADCDAHDALRKIKLLEEEEPQLRVNRNEEHRNIQVDLMGEVQLEILQSILDERFGLHVEFGARQIAYKETIADTVIGSGHFEPLRHFAEVHLLMEPGEAGSGLVFDSVCGEDELALNWQRLIMTHLSERRHRGVLIGAPLTDMKITILAGKAHLKHTEGGDFRQATYRAIGQGLRKAKSLLLEPWYEFTLEVPTTSVGRSMSDVKRMSGEIVSSETKGNETRLIGTVPVSEMKDYAIEVASYTGGYGRLACKPCGYREAHDARDVIEAAEYDCERDLKNSGDSVFCEHGAGRNVKWYDADTLMHIHPKIKTEDPEEAHVDAGIAPAKKLNAGYTTSEEEAELKKTLGSAYIAPKEKKAIPKRIIKSADSEGREMREILPEYLLVDGYNIIFAWDELKALAKDNIDSAREALIEILSNYQGYRKCEVIVVFDAYRVKGGEQHSERVGDIEVVYTKEAETADTYIERATYEMKKKYSVRVATSDNLEQLIVTGNDAFKISAKDFKVEIEATNREIDKLLEKYNRSSELQGKNRITIP